MSYTLTFSIGLGAAYASSTLEAQFKDTAGTNVGGIVTTGFVHLGSGAFSWTGTIPDAHRGSVIFRELGQSTVLAAAAINPEEGEYLATRLPSSLVDGRMDSYVGAMGSGVVTAAAVATGAIDADALAADAGTELGTAVWASATRTLTQAAASVAATVAGTTLTLKRGDSFSANLTGLGDISTRSKLWFTVKAGRDQADSASQIQIEESGGLLYLAGAAAASSGQGSLTVTNAATGALTIAIDEAATALLSGRPGLVYDIQVRTAAGAVQTLTEGDFTVSADVTRATS